MLETKEHRRDASINIRPRTVHIVPRLPRKRGRAPCQCTISHVCHLKGIAKGHQGVHLTPLQYTLSHVCHAMVAETKEHWREARTYIRPLGTARCPIPGTRKAHRERPGVGNVRCSMPTTQRQRRPNDTGGTPGRTSDPLAVYIVPRLPRKSGGDQGTPAGRQGVHPTPCLFTASHVFHSKVAETKVYLPRKRGGDQGTLMGREGVHPTPWHCTLSHISYVMAVETKRHRRDARAYIRPLGNVPYNLSIIQKRRKPMDFGTTSG